MEEADVYYRYQVSVVRACMHTAVVDNAHRSVLWNCSEVLNTVHRGHLSGGSDLYVVLWKVEVGK